MMGYRNRSGKDLLGSLSDKVGQQGDPILTGDSVLEVEPEGHTVTVQGGLAPQVSDFIHYNTAETATKRSSGVRERAGIGGGAPESLAPPQ